MELSIPLFDYQQALKFGVEGNKRTIFDPIRKKYLFLQPEELVRQLWVQYFIQTLAYPSHLMAIEQQIMINGLTRRYDIALYNRGMKAVVLVECKAPKVEISQAAFDQIAQYNMVLKVPYLVVSNGRTTYACAIDWQNECYTFIEEIPAFEQLDKVF